ncbi:MAG: class I tRNA ligase family protein, partial [Planctomycetes bacterium]|nr:class I tRNA ligase family protein [Planctomycetota bacterium]
NVACAVHPDLEYARVEQKGCTLILAKDRLAVLQELGPHKVLATFPGRDLVGRAYAGAFDDWATPREARHAHRVIPWKEVLATEGTGIVHIAPGCGKEDFDLGRENALPVLAPIDEAGLYVAGYGPLTGKLASGVAEEVLSHLRERGHYYKKERYSHDYPHCWRCGTNLLFRTVDEWFISMSWRDEIAAVARQIRWIPGHGLDQELDWLSNMGDWMISKKRYWGLALPIWTCTEGHFDVIGSGEELRARATAGWDAFEGHSPHRPWVDAVRIACSTCGKDASRIPDVGNPWLDAGIVPYSTVRYETDREYWKRWIPADAVVECFPGQFRNWFYALLAMSTMMENLPPFRTLLGHALVRDEKGAEMHKSTGNAIGFDEAAEKAGVDTLRWIYCRQNPVTNLNFGYGVADAVKRRFFNTWWNVYAFFANYARSDRFDPRQPAVPVAERQDIDRWILSRLHGVARLARERLGDFDTPLLARAAEEFVDALSTWYVRRCRRRFWRARSESDRDKLAAYQTLHEVLVTLAKLLAPLVPFTAEAMYQNLVRSWDADAPASVHHCAYPEPDAAGSDKALAREMDAALRLVSATLSLRESLSLRVRQPLRELTIATTDPVLQQAARRFEPHLLDELNLKSLRVQAQTGREVRCDVKPNFKTLGERYGKDRGLYIQALKGALAADPDRVSGEIERGVARIPLLDGTPWHVQRDEVLLQKGAAPGMENLAMAEHPGFTLLLDTTVTPEMAREGVARDLVRHIQQARGDLDLEFTSRIRVTIESDAAPLAQAIAAHRPFILEETFADELREEPTPDGREIDLGGMNIRLKVEPIGAPPSISR